MGSDVCRWPLEQSGPRSGTNTDKVMPGVSLDACGFARVTNKLVRATDIWGEGPFVTAA